MMPCDMNKLIEVISLKRIYLEADTEVEALKDVSFSVYLCDYLSIVGPSGAGKSTLLHLIGGIDTPTQGTILFKGEDIYKMNRKRRALWRNKNIGFIFQFYHLIEELNVLDNILVASFEDRKFSFKKAQELLKYLGIKERENFFPSQLSGGEKQKVAIARALINEPDLILCDEPTGNLDKESQERVMELLRKLNEEKKKTIVLVTHNLELAERAKRMVFIKNGEIVDKLF
ncbi:MAG TPA: ABC transporter ATP-binding protein [Candidatus Omnitrophica bacterium]|nr:ABC transporter ATP-binding protein [Candidatus Omnitrophota bacterium]